MAQTPKGRLVQGLYKPIHGTCAMYFYLGVLFHPKKGGVKDSKVKESFEATIDFQGTYEFFGSF